MKDLFQKFKQTVISTKKVDRKEIFKNRKDNSKWDINELTQEEHEELYYSLMILLNMGADAKNAPRYINELYEKFISKFSYNRPVYWHFHQWDQTSFLSDEFMELLMELDVDYSFISNQPLSYISLYD